jgi:signal transduction histidine kinase
VSNDGLIWISTQENKLFQIDPNIRQISEVPQRSLISSLVVKDTSELWMGTYSDGLLQENRITEKIVQFTNNNKDAQSLSNDTVTKLYVDRKDHLWIGTANGLNLFNERSNSFTRFIHDTTDTGSLSNSYISDIYEDSHSNLWIGTVNGVNRLDRKKGTFKSYTNQQSNFSDTAGWGIKIVEDLSGKVWFGSVEGGVYNVNEQTDQLELVFTGPAIRDLYVDKKGILWAGANTGLWSSDKDWTKMSLFKINETGTFIGEWTYSLTGDAADNLWIGTNAAIIKLGTDRKNKEIFGIKNGVQVNGNPNLAYVYKDYEGRMYFATSPNGYYTFQPQDFNKSISKMALYAMDLKVNNQPVYARENGILETSLFRAEEIRLKYNENNFSLTFAAVDLRAELKKQIFYMLEGYDSEWQESLSGQKVNYNKVPPGNYTLTFRSAIRNSSDWEEKSLRISIAPPWWKTGWSYSVYAVLLALGFFYFDKYQKRRILAKEKALAKEKELAHAREIEKAYLKLQATQTQLIQSEKMASLGELTAGIAHEIQNPLNFVNNFSEVSNELIDEMNEEIEKGDLEEAKAIAEDIKQNLEKINHHGKRADGIVKGMLQHSRSSTGTKEPTDINVLADEYLRLAYHGLRAKDKGFNATLETHFDETIGKVNVVSQDIGRVILNLINNAFYVVQEKSSEALAKGDDTYEPTVTVSTKKTKEGIEISVKDNGNGIPDAIKEKIFQPFFTTKPTGQGTGLGLSLSYDIVKAHGGDLKVETRKGEGTEFIISLPA